MVNLHSEIHFTTETQRHEAYNSYHSPLTTYKRHLTHKPSYEVPTDYLTTEYRLPTSKPQANSNLDRGVVTIFTFKFD